MLSYSIERIGIIVLLVLYVWLYIVLKTPRSGRIADFNVHFEWCAISDYGAETSKILPASTDQRLTQYGTVHVGGGISQVRVDLPSLMMASGSNPAGSLYQDMMCVLHEVELANNKLVANILHFGRPLGNIATNSSSYRKLYPGPGGATIVAWMKMPREDNVWRVMNRGLGVESGGSGPGTKELVLEIRL